MAAASRKCACGARATREKQGSKWVPLPECRRCLAATRIAGVVNGLTGARMRYVEKELELLRAVEVYARQVAEEANVDRGSPIGMVLQTLDTLRALQEQQANDRE